MTSFTLSTGTQNAINYAVANGPGTNNANYLTAYTDIYNDLVAEGGINSSVLFWFSQAGSINSAQYASTPSAAAVFIWNYTRGAASSEGVTLTNTELQNASNAIASGVFATLKNASFVFNDADNFSPTNIVANDASQAITTLQGDFPSAGLDWAIWGGTLFAQTELGDSTYIADHGIDITPGSRDANAIEAGAFNAAQALYSGGYVFTSDGFTGVTNLDLNTLNSAISGTTDSVLSWSFAATGSTLLGLASLAAHVNYLWNASTGSMIQLDTSSTSSPGMAYVYEPTNNGTLSFEQGSGGSGTLLLQYGNYINIGGAADLAVTAIDGGSDTDEQALLEYLNDSGVSITAAQLNTDNFNAINPTGSSYTVTPALDGSGDANFYLNDAAPGAVLTGISGDTNILTASGDISRDSISGMQTLDVGGNVTLTGSQFGSFSTFEGGGGITITSSGTYSIASLPGFGVLEAEDWGGTVLTANNGNYDVLIASLFGNDTLNAGSGIGQEMDAGEGVDTLNGGTGGDIFSVPYSLAAGSTIHGEGTGNSLEVGDYTDLSDSTISDIQSLVAISSDPATVELKASQLSEFTSIQGDFTLEGTGGGAFSLAGITIDGQVTLESDTGSATTVTLGTGAESFIGSAGNDTFQVAGALAATDVLTGGTGSNAMQITAANASIASATISNITSLEIKNGASTTVTLAQFNAFTTYTADSGAGAVKVSGAGSYSLSGKTVTGALIIDASSSTGNYTLTGNNTAYQTLNGSSGSSSTDTIATGTGTEDTVNANGINDFVTLNGTYGTANINDASGAWTNVNGANDLVNDYGSGDTLYVTGTYAWINSNGGSQSITTTSTSSYDTVNINGSSTWANITGSNDTINANGSYDNVTLNGSTDWVYINASHVTVALDGATGNVTAVTGASSTNAWININANGNVVTLNGTNGSATASSGYSNDWINVNGTANVATLSGTGDTAYLTGASEDAWVNVGGSGNGTNGSGTGNTFNITASSNTIGGGGDTFILANGLSDTLNGGESDTYEFGSTFGSSVTLDNTQFGSATTANGKLTFASGVTDENLWFQRSGNNLLIDLLGTTDKITIDNWFGSNAGAQLSEIDAGSLKLTTAVASLVSAMATYAGAHTGFNPQASGTTMPTDTTLQNAIAGTGSSAWHS